MPNRQMCSVAEAVAKSLPKPAPARDDRLIALVYQPTYFAAIGLRLVRDLLFPYIHPDPRQSYSNMNVEPTELGLLHSSVINLYAATPVKDGLYAHVQASPESTLVNLHHKYLCIKCDHRGISWQESQRYKRLPMYFQDMKPVQRLPCGALLLRGQSGTYKIYARDSMPIMSVYMPAEYNPDMHIIDDFGALHQKPNYPELYTFCLRNAKVRTLTDAESLAIFRLILC